MNLLRMRRDLGVAIADLLAPADVPGYATLGWRDRRLTDLRALRLVLRLPACWRVLAFYVAWLLIGKIMVWRAGISGLAVHAPELTAALWLLPLAAYARRCALRQVLGPHWSRL